VRRTEAAGGRGFCVATRGCLGGLGLSCAVPAPCVLIQIGKPNDVEDRRFVVDGGAMLMHSPGPLDRKNCAFSVPGFFNILKKIYQRLF
jgi:hypothetical protein